MQPRERSEASPARFIPAGTSLAPGDERELAEIVADHAARKVPLWSEGGGTKRHHGPAAPLTAQHLSMRRLGRITAHDPGDQVVSVQAGARLTDVQRILAQHRQWLPLDPPYAGATIGGILAAASAGPRRLGYGTIKDYLLGARVAGVHGGITQSGGRVVKNVTGYDLHRLQVGAFGSLGILLEAHLKVTTRPPVTAALLVGFAGFSEAVVFLLGIWDKAIRPVALEALDAEAATSLRALTPELPTAGAVAVVGLEGGRALVERQVRAIRQHQDGVGTPAVLLEGAASERLWLAFRDAPTRAAGHMIARVGVRPHDLPDLLPILAPDLPAGTACSCQAGTGLLRLRLPAALEAERALEPLRRCGEAAAALGGYLVMESAPQGLAGRERLPWGTGSSGLARRLKEAWDPHGILNPGRMAL